MGGAVGFEGPNLHLAEPLSTELGLTAQGLLGDEGVGARGPGVDLVLDEVYELHHVDGPNGDGLVEGLSGAAVSEEGLAEEGRDEGPGRIWPG